MMLPRRAWLTPPEVASTTTAMGQVLHLNHCPSVLLRTREAKTLIRASAVEASFDQDDGRSLDHACFLNYSFAIAYWLGYMSLAADSVSLASCRLHNP